MIRRRGPAGGAPSGDTSPMQIPQLTPPGASPQGGGWNPPSYIENTQSGRPSFTPPQEMDGDKRELKSAGAGATVTKQAPPDFGVEPSRAEPTPAIGGGVSVPPPPGVVTTTPTPVLLPPPPMVEPPNPGGAAVGGEPELSRAGGKAGRTDTGDLMGGKTQLPGGKPANENGFRPFEPPTITPPTIEPSRTEPQLPVPETPGTTLPLPPDAIVEPPQPEIAVEGPGQGQDSSALFGDFGKLLREALQKPSRYDAEEAKKFYEYGKADLTRQRDMDLSESDAEAASRGVFYGTPGLNMRMDAKERFGRGLADLQTNIAREQATTAGQDRAGAVQDVFNFLGQGREDDKMKVAIAQLIGSMGNQGSLDFSGLDMGGAEPEFGGGVDWASLGSMFSGGGAGAQAKPPVQGAKAPTPTKPNIPNPPVKGPPKLTVEDAKKKGGTR